jgi:hypothetical protein
MQSEAFFVNFENAIQLKVKSWRMISSSFKGFIRAQGITSSDY